MEWNDICIYYMLYIHIIDFMYVSFLYIDLYMLIHLSFRFGTHTQNASRHICACVNKSKT